MKILFYLIFICYFLISCNDSTNEPKIEKKNYVEGNVAVGLNDEISFEQMLDTIYSFGTIYKLSISTIQYSSTLPQNDFQFIQDKIKTFSFIDTTSSIKFNEQNSEWEFNFWISNFEEKNINDWNQLLKDLQLIHKNNLFQIGLLEVEPGLEKYWIDKLLKINIFRWVELNTITHTSN